MLPGLAEFSQFGSEPAWSEPCLVAGDWDPVLQAVEDPCSPEQAGQVTGLGSWGMG